MSAVLKRLAPWVLCALALAAAIVFFLLWQQERSAAQARAEMRSQADRFVTALTNFSAETIDDDAARIKSFAVGDFAKEAEAFFGDKAVAAIEEAGAVSEGEIESMFVQELEDDSGSVFAVVSETVTNSQRAQPQTDTLRLEVGMIETSSGWKVNRVDVLQSPGTVLP